MKEKLETEVKELASLPVEELPTKIKFNEFLQSIAKSREFLPETLGGFIAWMKRQGIPKSLPFNRWKELLIEYSTRKV